MKKNKIPSLGMHLALLLLLSALCLTLFACLPSTPTPTPDPSVPSDPVDPDVPAEPEKLTVTFQVQNGDANSTETVEYGAKVNKPADPEKIGYTFVGWNLDGVAYDFNTTITGNITLTAEWQINTYTVTFDAKNDTEATKQTVNYGATVSKPAAPEKVGYTFVGWNLDGTAYDFNSAITGDITLVAEWKINTYTVTFTNGDATSTETVEHGAKVNKPTDPTKTGYTFVGWNLDGVAYDFNAAVTGDITLVAGWKINTYTVTFTNDGTSTTETVEHGAKVNAPTQPTKMGYTFVGWNLDGVSYDFNTAITGDITLVAEWKINTYTVTFDAQNDTEATKQTLNHGATVSKPTAPNKTGYTFVGWTLNGVAYDFNTAVTGDITLVAEWKVNTYTVTFTNDGTSTTETVEHGAKVNKPTDPTKTGYTFVGWNLNGVAYDFNTAITGNITLTAEWQINTYTVTFDTKNDTEATKQTVNYGATVSKPTAPEKVGYTFVGWTLDGVAYDFNTAITGNITLTAEWKINTYTVTFTNDGTSTIETVEYGAKVTKPADPTKTGYTFLGWYLGEVVYDFEAAVTEEITLVAKWQINGYTVTFKNDGAVTTETIEYGAKVNKPTDPTKTGYTFLGWYVGENVYDFETAVTEEITLVAKWKINTYTVTFTNDGTSTTETVEHGAKVNKPTDPTKTGYTFVGWNFDGVAYDFNTAVTGDITLVAEWKMNTYTVTFDPDNGSTPTTVTVEHGGKVSKPTDPTKAGHTFLGWYVGDKQYSFRTQVVSDLTITAKWEALTYTITFDTNGGDALEPMKVTEGTVLSELPVPTKNGYTYTGWKHNGVAVSYPFTVSGNMTLTTTWELATYKITYVLNGGRTIGNAPQSFTINSAKITLPYANKSNYDFLGWTWEGQDTPVFDVVIPTGSTGDRTYIANFAVQTYEITFVTGDTQKVITLNKGAVPSYGADAPSYNGMEFVMWYPAIKIVSGNATYHAVYADQMSAADLKRALETQNFVWQSHGYRDMQVATTFYGLVLQEHESPLSGYVRDRIIEQIGHLTASGSAPEFDCSTNWPYGIVCAALAMAKDTPSVWDHMSASLKAKVDTMMEAFAYIVSLGTSDQNSYQTGPALGGNYNKNWNVNYALGSIPCMVFVVHYFGEGDIDEGARIVNEKLKSFDEAEYDRMIRAFETYGWANAKTCWTTPSPQSGYADAKQMLVYGGTVYGDNFRNPGTLTNCGTGKGVNNGGVDYTYSNPNPVHGGPYTGIPLDKPEEIVKCMIDYNFAWETYSEHYYNGERVAWILDGTNSPYHGMMGMMYEFGLANRSAITYTGHDFDMITVLMSAARALKRYEVNGEERVPVLDEDGKHKSIYDYTEDDERWSRIQVGMEDFIYKYVHGYQDFVSYTQGGIVDSQMQESGAGIGYWIAKGVWRTTMKPLGDLPLAEANFGSHTVTFDPGNGGALTTLTVKHATLPSVPVAPTKEGYVFLGWYDGETKYDFATPITKDVTFVARWTDECVLTYDPNGGSVSPSSHTGKIGSAVTLPTPTRSGYTFNGWYTEASGGSKVGGGGANYTLPSPSITLYAQWTATGSSGGSDCVTGDTLVTMADGSKKPICEVTMEDTLLVWSFYDGRFEAAPAAILLHHGFDHNTVIALSFSDGTVVKVVNSHQFFDQEANAFVEVNAQTVASLLGRSFLKVVDGAFASVTLTDYTVSREYIEAFGILSAQHYNLLVEDMLSTDIPPYVYHTFRVFEIGEGMTYDRETIEKDIKTYGLYTYEEFKDYLTYEQFVGFGVQFMKINVEKGLLSFDYILWLIDYYLSA